MAVADPEDAPAGFVSEQAHSIKGMYVCCPEDAGVPIPEPGAQIKNYLKRRELER